MTLFTRKPVSMVKRLAVANGWDVVYHQGDDYVVADPRRQLAYDIHLYYRPASPILRMYAGVSQPLPALTLPVSLFAGLLARHQLFGTYHTLPEGNTHLRFVMTYTALTAGLSGELFGKIARLMARNVGELEAALREQGLL